MTAPTHRRAGIVCIALALVFSVYSGRLIHLQVGKHLEYERLAVEKTAEKKIVPAERGLITDLHGEPLAVNVPIYTVVVDGTLVTDRPRLADILSRRLGLPVAQVADRIGSRRPYIVVQRKVDAETKSQLQKDLADAKLRGVMYEPEPVRNYPNDTMLAPVIGFLDRDGHGVQGVEMMMEPYLRGEDGFVYTSRDRMGREIVAYRGLERPPRNGMTVQLTVDLALQDIVEEELSESFRMLQPRTISAVFVRPRTGEVLAMATIPGFNLNEPGKAPVETTKNRAIVDIYEPGSTFKLVVVSAALEEHAVTPQTVFHCENGSFAYAGKILRDAHGHGPLTVHDILVKSSNIGCAKIAMHLGADKFHEYIRRFGFGERTGVGLPGEVGGIVRPRHSWTGLSITRIPMGHEVAVTPLQVVMAMSAIANGGNMMLPQIVHSVRDGSGGEVQSFHPQVLRRVVSEETAKQVASALSEVVSDRGTAKLASIPGFRVAGKTGTAQRVDPKGGYTPGKYVVSFAGYFPEDNPEVAGIVVVDDPRTPGSTVYGGTIAAPIFARIGARMARQMDLEPETEDPDGATVALLPSQQEEIN